jgi:GTPase SAR1 family protein
MKRKGPSRSKKRIELIFIIGPCSMGKSSFINFIIDQKFSFGEKRISKDNLENIFNPTIEDKIKDLKKEQLKKDYSKDPFVISLLVRMFKWKVEFEQIQIILQFQRIEFGEYSNSCDFHKEFVIYLK